MKTGFRQRVSAIFKETFLLIWNAFYPELKHTDQLNEEIWFLESKKLFRCRFYLKMKTRLIKGESFWKGKESPRSISQLTSSRRVQRFQENILVPKIRRRSYEHQKNKLPILYSSGSQDRPTKTGTHTSHKHRTLGPANLSESQKWGAQHLSAVRDNKQRNVDGT